MESLSCCFTGHRRLPANKTPKIVTSLAREIENLIAKGVTDFISGGAIGFDQIAASLIVAKKEAGHNIRLIFALPCQNQDSKWAEKQRVLYHNLLDKADEIIYVSEDYDPFCMKRRNQYMVGMQATAFVPCSTIEAAQAKPCPTHGKRACRLSIQPNSPPHRSIVFILCISDRGIVFAGLKCYNEHYTAQIEVGESK